MAVKPYEKKEYQQSQAVTDAQQAAQNHQQFRPGEYQSPWQEKADAVLGQIQDRGPFQYDASKDAAYQQAVDRYLGMGKRAMQDTVGQITAQTGGYGNSYAQMAGQQAYQGHIQALGEVGDRYYGRALGAYQQQGDDLMDQFRILSQREQDSYSRYQQGLNQFLEQQYRLEDKAERAADKDYNQFMQNQQFDYGAWRDALGDQERADAAAKEQERYDQQWQHQIQKENRSQLLMLLERHHYPTDAEIAAAGMTKAQIDSLWNNLFPPAAPMEEYAEGGGGRNPVQEWKEWVAEQEEAKKAGSAGAEYRPSTIFPHNGGGNAYFPHERWSYSKQ